MISGIGGGTIDLALYTAASTEAELQRAANVKILKIALESEKTMMNDLLNSMGMARYVDIYV